MDVRLKVQNETMLVGQVYEVKWDDLKTFKYKIKETMHLIDQHRESMSITNRHKQIGVSQHLLSDGFIYFVGVEVEPDSFIPDDLVVFMMPAGLVLRTKHITLAQIHSTYKALKTWLDESDYEVFKEPGIPYYDQLPIKYELYDQRRGDMEIRLPVQRKQ